MTLPLEPTIPTYWPKFLTAGATFKLDRVFREYSQPDWNLALLFAGVTVASFTTPQIVKDPDGRTYHIVLSGADTATLNPAGGASLAFSVVERLTGITAPSIGEIFDVATHRIMISPNVATATAGDFLSPEEKLLVQYQAALAARLAGNAIESYSVAGRSVTKISTKELRETIGSLKWVVYRQRNPGRLGVPGEFRFPAETGTAPYPWPSAYKE
jgi:hypothetical protein